MTEKFCKLTHGVMSATHWISKTTGARFSLTGDQKIIWTWMKSRYDFFSSRGDSWFDNQDDIAEATGCSPLTVKRFIKALAEHGYIQIQKVRLRGFVSSNVYKITHDLELYVGNAPQKLHKVDLVKGEAVSFGIFDTPATASQEAVELSVPVFEDVPLEAYIDKPPKAPVVVLETLQGFADTLDEEIKFEIPILPEGAGFGSNESDPW